MNISSAKYLYDTKNNKKYILEEKKYEY